MAWRIAASHNKSKYRLFPTVPLILVTHRPLKRSEQSAATRRLDGGFLAYLYVYFAKLLFGYLCGCAEQKILSVRVHRECDNLSYALIACEEHYHTVNTGCHTCVRRSAVLERIVERAELFGNVLLCVACYLECIYLYLKVVVSYSAA